MSKLNLSAKLKEHMLNTVGKKPTKNEMKSINKQIKPLFSKIYAHSDKITTFVKTGYDAQLTKLWIPTVANESFLKEIKLFLKFTRIKPNYKIASLASGLAVYELFLAKEYIPQGKVYCIELSREMNKYAAAIVKRINQRNVKILTASATNLPLKNNSQDIILARRTGLSNDQKWGQVLNESYRILKKNKDSTPVITVDKVFNKKLGEIKADLKKANFNLITIKDFRRNKDELVVSMTIAKPLVK